MQKNNPTNDSSNRINLRYFVSLKKLNFHILFITLKFVGTHNQNVCRHKSKQVNCQKISIQEYNNYVFERLDLIYLKVNKCLFIC